MEHESILSRIDAPRIRLRQENDPDYTVQEISLRQSGRYEVLGQIAKGGVGQILKGRDVDLGRDVALKMLRRCHVENAELVQRFVEEAQIGGQLQHPGIVPVYELGLQADGLPFFAMKLVKGRTLAALIAERKDLSEGRRRLLAVFEQVCQTMAYAHSRGVIHRDLKPANIMVGAFGEVQIVDWGFAKVIAHGGVADERRVKQADTDMTRIATVRSGEGSDSIPGSVMGTPAYMPPEQALGHIDDLDERSDVFSLGAILCEILTGKPPYVGEGKDVFVLASQGRVEDAYERLDGCGRDPRLIELAKTCLSPLRQKRPRNAAELPAIVTTHLARVEERAQRAKLAAVDARRQAAQKKAEADEQQAAAEAARAEAEQQRAKAERSGERAERAANAAAEDRRARRRTLSLAAAILLVAVAGGSGYLWIEKGRGERATETTAKVNEALAEARRLKGERKWAEAIVAAQRAVDVADGYGDERARSVLNDVREGERRAGEAKTRLDRERTFLAQLAEARLRHDDAAYAAALRGHDGATRAEAVAALDDWALLRGKNWKKHVRAARTADADELRNRIRGGDFPESVDPQKQSPRTLDLLGHTLVATGEVQRGVDLLRRAQAHYPQDPWLNRHLALGLMRLSPPRRVEALRFLTAARVSYPESEALKEAIAGVQQKSNDLDALRADVGYDDARQWFSFELRRSGITGTRRRIRFKKEAVTNALLDHKGGHEAQAAPMVYKPNTVFVAETLDDEGRIMDTETLRIRYLSAHGTWHGTHRPASSRPAP